MHSPTELKKLASQEGNARTRMRLLALYHFRLGKNRTQIAELLGVARGSVNKWVSRYLDSGLDGLQTKAGTGRPPKLTNRQQKHLAAFVLSQVDREEGGRLTGYDVHSYISQQFKVDYSLRHIYHLLHRLGFSWITSRSKHPKQSEKAQEVFKNLPTGNDPTHPV